MLTLNQIVSQITNLATAHNQIAESGVGDFAEWQAKERSYPILWVFHESTAVSQMEIAFSIRLICADRVIVGEEGDDTQGHEQEVISDTLLVLLDFLAYFQQNHSQPYDVVTSATIDPFTERLNDRLAGNSVTIQIRQPFDWNKCQIPQTGASIPPTVDGLTLYNFCDPAVIARLTPEQVACLEAEYGVTCLDGTVNITNTDADPIATVTVASGGVEPYVIPNVSWTNSDGSAESTPYGDAIVCDMAGPSGGVTVTVSDTTPDQLTTLTITATSSGFTPTLHRFLLFNGSVTLLAQQVGNVLNWTVNVAAGNYTVYVLATDGTVRVWNSIAIEVIQAYQSETLVYMTAVGIAADGNMTVHGITGSQLWSAVDTFVLAGKSGAWLSKCIAVYPYVGGTSATNKWNLMNPLDTNAAFRQLFGGGITINANGITGNGTNAYADTGITPSSHLGLDNAGATVYQRNAVISGGADRFIFGALISSGAIGLDTATAGSYYYFANEINFDVASFGAFNGVFSVNRTASNAKAVFRNGVKVAQVTTVSTVLPNVPIQVLCSSVTGGGRNYYGDFNVATLAVHQGMSDADIISLHSAITTFNTALGR